MVGESSQPLIQQESDSTSADKPDDGGDSNINVPMVHRERNELWHYLWNHSIADGLERTGTGSSHGLHRPGVDAFHGFCVQLAQGPNGEDSKGKNSREGPKTNPQTKDRGHTRASKVRMMFKKAREVL